jgi:hypothetical protein
MNILFSDDFAEEFSSIGNTANRQTLDVGKAAYESGFWSKIEAAYLVSKPEYDTLQFEEDEIINETTINPAKIVKHDWKKLRSIWKAVNADYKQACDRFTQSGTHDSTFYSFCNGKKEAYYLRLLLGNRPSLNEMVEADLPHGSSWSSSSNSTSKDLDNCPRANKKRSIDNLADVIKESFDNRNNEELAETKISFMNNETIRKDSLFKLQLEETKLKEWTMIRENIKKLLFLLLLLFLLFLLLVLLLVIMTTVKRLYVADLVGGWNFYTY